MPIIRRRSGSLLVAGPAVVAPGTQVFMGDDTTTAFQLGRPLDVKIDLLIPTTSLVVD